MYHQGLQIFLPSETPVKRNRQASIVGMFFFKPPSSLNQVKFQRFQLHFGESSACKGSVSEHEPIFPHWAYSSK